MLRSIRKYTLLTTLALLGSFIGNANRVLAQTYQIDCAILLCLSGGWPASVPCARARAEFIRRITPWPIEPPLQIWRCPMGATYLQDYSRDDVARFYDISSTNQNNPMPMSFPRTRLRLFEKSVLKLSRTKPTLLLEGFALRLVQDRSDIDISGPEFNFVRTIRVFDVRYARQVQTGSEGGCERSATIHLGTYGTQGNFAWARSLPESLPLVHSGLESWGLDCPSIDHRSVLVDWRDYLGNYGFEQVNY